MKNNSFKGIFYLLTTAILWGTGFVSQFIGSEYLNPYGFTFFRCLVGIICLFIIIILNNYKKYKKIIFFEPKEDIKKTILYSIGCGITLFFGMIFQQIGIEYTIAAKASFIAALTVIFVPIVTLFFGNIIKLKTWFFILTTIFGIFLLNYNTESGINKGDVICLISTLCFTFDIILISKFSQDIDSLKFSFFRFFTVTIISLILLIFHLPSKNDVYLAMPAILYSGIFSICVAYTLQIVGQKIVEPIIATLILSLEGMFGTIFACIILNQYLNSIQVVGCIIITISIIMVEITRYKND